MTATAQKTTVVIFPILLGVAVMILYNNLEINYDLHCVLQVLTMASVFMLIIATLKSLLRSEYSVKSLILALVRSWYNVARNIVCPVRQRVIIRYHRREWRYMIYSVLIIFEVLLFTGMSEHMYSGSFIYKNLSLYIGQIGIYSILALYIYKLEKQKA